jgi:hypothetical protein
MISLRRSPPATAAPAARWRRRRDFIWYGSNIEASRVAPLPRRALCPCSHYLFFDVAQAVLAEEYLVAHKEGWAVEGTARDG